MVGRASGIGFTPYSTSLGKSFTGCLEIISLHRKISLPIKVQSMRDNILWLSLSLCVALNNSDVFFLMSESESMRVFNRRIY